VIETISTGAHRLLLLPDMRSLLEALRGDVERARSRVWIETYIYRDDRFGHEFARRLVRAARRGCDVRLLYDALGSNKSDARFFERLRAKGVQARPYRPLVVVLRAGMWPRTHARLVILDGRGYVGGAAWGDEWLPEAEGGKGWHEVCARLEGPCIADYASAFERHWREARSTNGGFVYDTESKHNGVELVVDSPARQNTVYEMHRERVQRARKRVWLENAYFCPPRAFARDLAAAAARGVDVKIVVPGPTDLPSIQSAGRALFQAFSQAKIRIFEYQPSVLHAKFALIDDDWATVGTFNANATSLRWANEANLFVRDRRFVAQLGRVFERDLASAIEVTPEVIGRRHPLQALKDRAWNAVLGWLDS
jgi:cardiolipin synthase